MATKIVFNPFTSQFDYINKHSLNLESYLSDSNTQAWYKMDEFEDNTSLFDFSDNGYDLANNGIQENHPVCVFGTGTRPFSTDRATRALTSSTNLQITGALTVEGFLTPENLIFSDGTIINVGHDFYNNQYGYIMYLTSTDLVWKICTNIGVYTCTTPISAFTAYNTYLFRGVYTGSQIELWVQDLGTAAASNWATFDYPAHRAFTDSIGTLTLKATTITSGTIQYNTGNYDWVSLARSWNTNTSTWDYPLNSVIYDSWSISNIVRTTNYYNDNNIVPDKDAAVNLGSRFSRFGNIHAMRLFGTIGNDVVKDYSIDWGTGSGQVNASDIPIIDTGGLYTTDIVENALAEVKTQANTNATDLSTHEADLTNPHDTDFLLLDDTPSSYSGEAGEFLKVNAAEDALEFTSAVEIENTSRSIYVDADTGSDSNDGTSWGQAFLTMQKGIDDIKSFINAGVNITVWCRGEFSEGDEEGAVCRIGKICVGNGNIFVRADDYKALTAPTSATSTTLVFSGTYDTDFWKDCYVWIRSGNGVGEAKRITSSSSSGGSTTVNVSAWSTTPNTGSRFAIAGRARFTQPATAKNWKAIDVFGATIRVFCYGLAAFDYDDGETTPFLVRDYGYMSNSYCIGFGNGAGDNADFYSTNYGSQNNVLCASFESGNYGFQVFRYAKSNQNQCNVTDPANDGIHLEQLSFGYQFRTHFIGGVNSINVMQSSLQTRESYGTDGSSRGVILDGQSAISIIGSQALTIEQENDRTSANTLLLRTSASAQPTPETGELRIWRDPDDNKTYLLYEDPDEGSRKVELT